MSLARRRKGWRAYRGRPERVLHELTMRALASLRPPIRRILLFIGCAPTPVETHRHAHPLIYFASSNLRLPATVHACTYNLKLCTPALLLLQLSAPSACNLPVYPPFAAMSECLPALPVAAPEYDVWLFLLNGPTRCHLQPCL